MYTISRLAAKFKLTRSTLLYYDSIDLLKPTRRTDAEYRLYSEKDAARLEQIRTFRRAGLKLEEIKRILDAPGHDLKSALENRLEELDREIIDLKAQQRVIIGLLKNDRLFEKLGVMNKETWVALLEASGFSDEDMYHWHVEFERLAPDKHQRFLEFLGMPADEIRAVREMGKAPA
ncbi:MAG: MerR family transcriptional regulator [Pseudomonadota bacterium]